MFIVRTQDIVSSGLWVLFPVINVDSLKDIPRDYPGAMGVPITFFGQWNRGQFEILDCASPEVKGKSLYKRVIVRNLSPDMPEMVDIDEWLEKAGSTYEIAVVLKDRFVKKPYGEWREDKA